MSTRASFPSTRPSAPQHELVDGRYRILALLGKGGMADVFEAVDASTQRHVALKRLRPDGEHDSRRRVSMFELEFHTLAQLAHPRVVEAYDYGLTPQGPYYTMELLDGGDLSTLSPLPWKRACSLIRDVCSVLALLHSRRLVYRDLSTRNIRCTADGKAKLIDFGAMAAVGPSRDVVGSPPFVPPEALNLQPINVPIDLYAVGGALYFALVGRHAYPAKDLQQLPLVWQSPPPRPAELVKDLPPALDNLVMSLLDADPGARPASAAEVMEQLQAIAALPADDTLLTSQAHLSTPTLVGRDEELERIRRRIARTHKGRGSVVLLSGVSGVGRTRLLDACVMEATLSGVLVTRANASDAQSGGYGAVRAVARQLVRAVPRIVRETVAWRLPVLGHVLPELLELCPGVELEPFESQQELRPRLQTALREWLVDVSRERRLMLAVDDMDRIDEPSAALFAVLADQVRDQPMMLVASAEPASRAMASQALQLLSEAAKKMNVEPLSGEQTRDLVGSIFGRGERSDALADRLHAMSLGNPRDVMRLAQHLVDKGVVTYQEGGWMLPAEIAAEDLPTSVSAAMRTRLAALDEGAVQLAQGIALSDVAALTFDECLLLAEHGKTGKLLAELEALIAADIATEAAGHISIQQRVWLDVLLDSLDDDRRRMLHAKLATVFQGRGDNEVRVAKHVIRSGDVARGVDLLVEHARHSQEQTGSDADAFYRLLRALPAEWGEVYEEAIAYCEEKGRPRRDVHALRARFVGFLASESKGSTIHQHKVLEQLRHDAGLDIYAQLDASQDPQARLKEALDRAQARYEQLPESERVLGPLEAIRPLVRAVIQAIGIIVPTYEVGFLKSLPDIAPFTSLSPAVGVVNDLLYGVECRLTARLDRAREVYMRLLDRMAQPDRAGLDDSHHRHMQLGVAGGLGFFEASMGLASALDRATMLEAYPIYQVNGLCIRMLHSYWQGDVKGGDELKKQLVRLRVQNTSMLEGTHLIAEVRAYAMADDLTRLRRGIKEVEAVAGPTPGWIPVLHYVRGEYARICGNLAAALGEVEAGLRITGAGEHQAWPSLAAARVHGLVLQGRLEEARAAAETALREAEAADIGHMTSLIRLPYCLALVQLGELDEAECQADAVVQRFERLGATGLNVGVAYGMRARVALAARQKDACARFLEACAAHLDKPGHRWCQSRLEHLRQDMRAAGMLRDATTRLAGREGLPLETMLRNELSTCTSAEEHALRSLGILIEESGAEGGALFEVVGGAIEQRAKIRLEEDEAVEALARRYLEAELSASMDDTQDETEDATEDDTESGSRSTTWETSSEGRLHPVLLAHRASRRFVVTGLAVLESGPHRPLRPVLEVAEAISRATSSEVTSSRD